MIEFSKIDFSQQKPKDNDHSRPYACLDAKGTTRPNVIGTSNL
jgi:hypothetical protein